MRTVAVLPVKRFTEAKQRLGESVADQLRRTLAQAMVEDVLDALAATATIELTIVVSNEAAIASHAMALGALVIPDSAEEGQSAAASLGIARAAAEGAQRVLCVPGDCPALDPAELEGLLAAHALNGPELIVVPDRHGSGTNALLLHPPEAIEPSFGPGSRERHEALGAAAGVPCGVQPIASLALDIDTGADLAVLRERLSGAELRAAATRAVLAAEPAAAPVASHA
jgi:2-phospho-L-lactate/phosphoenolpyruvate guanylyltransferase